MSRARTRASARDGMLEASPKQATLFSNALPVTRGKGVLLFHHLDKQIPRLGRDDNDNFGAYGLLPRAAGARSSMQSASLAAWVYGRKADSTRGDERRDAGSIPPRPVCLDFPMTNRLQYLLGQIPEAIYTDYYEVDALGETYVVSLATAFAIERALDKAASPDWVEFRDVFGKEHRVLALCIYRIRECSGATREFLRAFAGARS